MPIFAHSLLHIYLGLRNKIYGSLKKIIFSSRDNVLGNKYLQEVKPRSFKGNLQKTLRKHL